LFALFFLHMFVDLGKEVQVKLVEAAIKKAGSEKKLQKVLKIPHSSIHDYRIYFSKLTYERFNQLLSFLSLRETDFKFKVIDPIEYRIKGGKATQRKYLREKRFEEIHKKMRAASSERMKKWHKKMKEENPEEYYCLQYSRFKKIANYKLKTKKGELVRNKLELQTADLLSELGIDYSYEPFLRGKKACYFSDFKIDNLIIECTMWRGFQKAYSLLEKIVDLESCGYNVKVVIPDNLRAFYKPIEKNSICTSELKIFLNAQVAQTGASC